jgi:hypothetical protein
VPTCYIFSLISVKYKKVDNCYLIVRWLVTLWYKILMINYLSYTIFFVIFVTHGLAKSFTDKSTSNLPKSIIGSQYQQLYGAINRMPCGEDKDLRKPSLGKVRNQSGLSWCYAYAVADYYSYYLNKKVSAVDVVISFVDHLRKQGSHREMLSDTKGQYLDQVLELVYKDGLCLESEVNSDAISHQQVDYGLLLEGEEVIREIESVKRSFDQLERIGRVAQLKCEENQLVSSVFPRVSYVDTFNALSFYTLDEIWAGLRDEHCSKKHKIAGKFKVKSAIKRDHGDSLPLLRLINSMLDSKTGKTEGSPVLLHYAANLPRGSKPITVNLDEFNHASMVVGRRINSKTGRCEYLVRNSWGEDRSPNPNLEWEDGNFWVSGFDLMMHTLSINYVVQDK